MSIHTTAQAAQQNNRDGIGQYQAKQNHEPAGGLPETYAAQRAAARPASDPLFGAPLTPYEMGLRFDGDTLASQIPVALENLDVNRDGFQDGLFKKLTGMDNDFEFEVTYKATGVTRRGAVILSSTVHIDPAEFEDLLTEEQHAEFLAGREERDNPAECLSAGPRIANDGRPVCHQRAGHSEAHRGFPGSGFENVTW